MLRLSVAATTLLAFATGCSWAADAPKLPDSAKKLSAEEIVALYKDARVSGHNFEQKSLLTFSIATKSKGKTITGKWSMESGESGKVNMTYRVRGDRWCYKSKESGAKETCVSIFTDGAAVYEVNGKGIVTSKNTVSQ